MEDLARRMGRKVLDDRIPIMSVRPSRMPDGEDVDKQYERCRVIMLRLRARLARDGKISKEDRDDFGEIFVKTKHVRSDLDEDDFTHMGELLYWRNHPNENDGCCDYDEDLEMFDEEGDDEEKRVYQQDEDEVKEYSNRRLMQRGMAYVRMRMRRERLKKRTKKAKAGRTDELRLVAYLELEDRWAEIVDVPPSVIKRVHDAVKKKESLDITFDTGRRMSDRRMELRVDFQPDGAVVSLGLLPYKDERTLYDYIPIAFGDGLDDPIERGDVARMIKMMSELSAKRA